ncbi:MAG: ABC1 kinase family protein [Planctomycetota bacterium]
MKITSLPSLFRNVKRGTEIISILSRYGLADWLSHSNIDFIKDALRNPGGESLARHTRETRIRLALIELGPTFIKLGQLLSTRPDLIGIPLAEELRQLQTSVPADSAAQVRATVESELGQPIEELFREFGDQPLASASIGQVHPARLLDGTAVVVKVQHEGIEKVIRDDLEILTGLALLAEQFPDFTNYRPHAIAAELTRTLRRELDFGIEERNLQQFAALLASLSGVQVPRTYPDLCTGRVLTMEYLQGVKLVERERLRALTVPLPDIARRGGEVYLHMIFSHGFYHADPHPGNFLILADGTLGILDFGMVGRIDERLREDIESMLLAIVQRDVTMLTLLIKRVGTTPADLDEASLANDVADFVGNYAGQSLDHFNLSGALTEMIEIVRRYRITLPSQVSMLIKTLVTLEGTARLLHPEFSLMEIMQPFHRKMLLQRLSPARHLRKLRRLSWEMENLIEALPSRISDILQQIQSGKFDVHLDHRGLEPSVNRLVLGMLASALFLGSSWLLSNQVSPLLFPGDGYFGINKLSILGLFGCTVAILIGLRLLRAIGKSGHLDRKR